MLVGLTASKSSRRFLNLEYWRPVFLQWIETLICCTGVFSFPPWLTRLVIVCFTSFSQSHLPQLDAISNILFLSLSFLLWFFHRTIYFFFLWVFCCSWHPCSFFFSAEYSVFHHKIPSPILSCSFASTSLAPHSSLLPAIPCFLCTLHCSWIFFLIVCFLLSQYFSPFLSTK